MIKDALKYIVSLGEAKVEDIVLPDGTKQTYSDKPLHRLSKHIPMASPIEMHTLTSLLDYIRAQVDELPSKMIIHVESPTQVSFYGMLNEERERELIAVVKAQIPSFEFSSFIEHEKFLIGVQAKFVANAASDRELVLKFAGTVEAGTVAEYGDDGVTQKATVKNGLTSKADAIVPNPVKLSPYRTFTEVCQPMTDFIFRMKQDRCGEVVCALFEADGGAWKNEAMQNVKLFLEKNLEGFDFITVIS